MDRVETNPIDENKPNIIRKKSSFLRDGSYRIFHITKKPKEDNDDDDNRNIDKKTISRNTKFQKKSFKKTNRNGLKQFFFPQKSSLSVEVKTSPSSRRPTKELSQSIICPDPASVNLLQTNKEDVKQENMVDWSKTNLTDGTVPRNKPLIRAHKFEPSGRKQVLANNHPEMQTSFHRRRKRFIVACGTVVVALSVIITIIVYVVVMTVRYITNTNRLAVNRHPRL